MAVINIILFIHGLLGWEIAPVLLNSIFFKRPGRECVTQAKMPRCNNWCAKMAREWPANFLSRALKWLSKCGAPIASPRTVYQLFKADWPCRWFDAANLRSARFGPSQIGVWFFFSVFVLLKVRHSNTSFVLLMKITLHHLSSVHNLRSIFSPIDSTHSRCVPSLWFDGLQ
jgi:hypothetical protein